MTNSTRQRMKAHRERKANIAAKRPVVETWKERSARLAAEHERRRRPRMLSDAALAAAAAGPPSLEMLDALFGEPGWPPRRGGR